MIRSQQWSQPRPCARLMWRRGGLNLPRQLIELPPIRTTEPLPGEVGTSDGAPSETAALYSWGGNSLGQIGNGNSKDVKAPLLIP